ncbi:ABC transporter permease [Ferrimonas sp.]|uniref:ABC transporter permease n=1 Tax=Ferrimonas sp. TaxID=2080861 RepID=UPI003A9497B3
MSWWQLFKLEWQGLLADKAAMLTAIGGILFYAVIYPLPYANHVALDQPVAVVDLDQSATSRQLLRMWLASPKVALTQVYPDQRSAESALTEGDLKGMIIIPHQFERNLYRGEQVQLAAAGDGSFLLPYSNLATAALEGAGYLSATVRLQRGVASGGNIATEMRRLQPVKVQFQPVFNPGMSYSSYVLPGALVLILHQTLLMVAAMLGANNWNTRGGWPGYPTATWLCARAAMLACLYLPSCVLYFDLVLPWQSVVMAAPFETMVSVLTPFLLATALAGVAISTLFQRRAVPVQLMVLTGMPILFTSGFVWPTDSMSALLSGLFAWLPAQPAMIAMIKANQLNLGLSGLGYELSSLWLQVLAWGILALLGLKRRQALGSHDPTDV